MAVLDITYQPLVLQYAGEKPTIPANNSIKPGDPGWQRTDLLVGEYAVNYIDNKFFYRAKSGIIDLDDVYFSSAGGKLSGDINLGHYSLLVKKSDTDPLLRMRSDGDSFIFYNDDDSKNADIKAGKYISDVPDGTSPFDIASSTVVTNLNADLLDGHHWSEIPTDTWRPITDTPVQDDSDTSISSAWAYTHQNLIGNEGHIPVAGQQGEFLAYNGAWATPDYIPQLTNDEVIAMLLTDYEQITTCSNLSDTDSIFTAFQKLECKMDNKDDMQWPASAGIPIYTGSNSWGTSITDNHANWDDAYSNRITSLTTNGTSGAATLIDHTLNIPVYTYTHPSKTWADKTNLSGATVISNLTIDSLGHPTDWTTRDLTPSDIGAQVAGDYQPHDTDLDEIAALTDEGYLKQTSSWGIVDTIPTADLNKAQPFSASILDTWADSVLDDGGDIENLSLYQEDYVTDDDFGISTYNAHQFDVTDGIVNLQADLDILNSITTRTYLGDLVNVTKGLFGGVTDDTVNSLQSDTIIATEYLRAKQRIEFDEYTSTGNPVAGKGWLYAKDGKIYYNNNSGSDYDLTSAGLGDAPADGDTYGRKDNAWVVVSGTSGSFTGWKWEVGSSFTISDSDVVKLVTATDATASALSIAAATDGADPQTITNTFKLDKDLDVIAALTGTGLLKRTGDGTWVLDTSNYAIGTFDNYQYWNAYVNGTSFKSVYTGTGSDYLDFVATDGINVGGNGKVITFKHNTLTPTKGTDDADTNYVLSSLEFDNYGHVSKYHYTNVPTQGAPSDAKITINTSGGLLINSANTDYFTLNQSDPKTIEFDLDDDLDAIASLTGTGFLKRIADNTWELTSVPSSYDGWELKVEGISRDIQSGNTVEFLGDNILSPEFTSQSNPFSVTYKHKAYSVSNVSLTGASVIETITFDGYGHVSDITKRDLTLSDIGADNYRYWKVYDGTNLGEIESTNILTFLGKGLVDVSYDDTAKSLSFSVEDNNFRKAQSFDFIDFLESMRDDIVSEGGDVENFDLYTKDYLGDVWGVSTFNKDEFIVVDGMVRLRASYLTDTGTLDTTSATTLTTGTESFKDAIQLHKISKTGKFDDLVDKDSVKWQLRENGTSVKDVGVGGYANFVSGNNITVSKDSNNNIKFDTLDIFNGTNNGFVPKPTSADSSKYLNAAAGWTTPPYYDYWTISDGTNNYNLVKHGKLTVSSENLGVVIDNETLKINHPNSYTAYNLDLSGAKVLATLKTDIIGSVTEITTRTLTPGDIGAQPSGSYDNYISWKLQVDANTAQDVGSGHTVKFISGTDIKLGQSTRDVSVAHDTVSRSNSTSSITPAFGDSFTAIDSVISSTTGHITEVNTKTIKLPVPDYYTHPTYTALDKTLTGATVLHTFKTDAIGSVTEFTTRELTLEDINAQVSGDYVEQTDKALPYENKLIETLHQQVTDDGGDTENIGLYHEDYIPKDNWGIATFNSRFFTSVDGVVGLQDNIDFFGNITAKNLNISQWDSSIVSITTGNILEATRTNNNVKIEHKTESGFKHIPSGGSAGQFLSYDSDGTAKWSNLPTDQQGVTRVSAGDGMSFTDITSTGLITLGIPSTISPTSTNGVEQGTHSHTLDTTDIALLDKANTFSKQNTFNEGIFIPNDKIVSLGNDYGAIWSDGGYTIIGTSDGASSTPYLKVEEQYGDVEVVNSLTVGGSATISGITKVGGHGTVSDPEVINTIYGTNATPPVDASNVPEGTVYIQYQA